MARTLNYEFWNGNSPINLDYCLFFVRSLYDNNSDVMYVPKSSVTPPFSVDCNLVYYPVTSQSTDVVRLKGFSDNSYQKSSLCCVDGDDKIYMLNNTVFRIEGGQIEFVSGKYFVYERKINQVSMRSMMYYRTQNVAYIVDADIFNSLKNKKFMNFLFKKLLPENIKKNIMFVDTQSYANDRMIVGASMVPRDKLENRIKRSTCTFANDYANIDISSFKSIDKAAEELSHCCQDSARQFLERMPNRVEKISDDELKKLNLPPRCNL